MGVAYTMAKVTNPQNSVNDAAKKGANFVKGVVVKHVRTSVVHLIRTGRIAHLIVFLFAVAALLLWTSESAAMECLLYIFAFDGKVSGRMDGNVMMRNGRGRAFVVPALVRNNYTMTQRGLFSTFSSTYAGLTAAQVDAWRNFTIDITNRFGQAKIVRGKEAFVALNVNLAMVGSASISDPPVFVGVPAIVTLAVTATAPGTLALAFTATPTDADVAHLVFATAPLGNGITRPSASAYRLIDVIPPATATPFAAGAAYVAKFGNLIAGDKVFVSLTAVDINTGQSTPSVAAFDVIA